MPLASVAIFLHSAVGNAVKQLARLPPDPLTLTPHESRMCLLPVRSPVLAVGNVHPAAGGPILYDPHERVEMLHNLEGSEEQRVALLESSRAHRQSSAVLRADRAGPDHVKVRKQRVVPAPDVAQDCGLKF